MGGVTNSKEFIRRQARVVAGTEEGLVVKWQYRLHVVSLKNRGAMASTVDDGLNGLGTDDWEAVACISNPESRYESYVLLKRPAG